MTGSDDVRQFLSRLRLPLIAAPMTGVSGWSLVAAASAAGVGGSFPAHNAGPAAEVDRWLRELEDREEDRLGPIVPNLVVHRSSPRLAGDLDVVCRHRVPAVITSVGSPRDVVGPLHDAGILVFSDVASIRHAERAIDAGVDGLVLLAAGAGGQTGWANPLVFARAVRAFWDGPLVLAGGVVDGASMLAALVAGYDLVYVGTPFIATTESNAAPEYKEAVVAATMDDIELRSDLTGLPSSMIRIDERPTTVPAADRDTYDARILERGATTNGALFSAGHSATGVRAIVDVAALVDRVERELHDELERFASQPWPTPSLSDPTTATRRSR